MLKKIEEMLRMQDELNQRLDPDWRNNHQMDFFRAIWIECAEAMDKVPGGWKWWKKQDGDIEQLKLELVDIWHFMLAMFIRTGAPADYVCESFTSEMPDVSDVDVSGCLAIEAIADAALEGNIAEVFGSFGFACEFLGLSFDELYELYVSKYTLNRFRWDNGYDDGSYRKIWVDGREDNEHLMDLAKSLSGRQDFAGDLYQGLQDCYRKS